MSLEHLIVEEKGAHPDHCEKRSHRSKDRACGGAARGFLRDVEAVDGYIQCRNNPAPAFRLVGVAYHGRIAR